MSERGQPEPMTSRSRLALVIVVAAVLLVAGVLVLVFTFALRIGWPTPHVSVPTLPALPTLPAGPTGQAGTAATGPIPPPTAGPGNSASQGIAAHNASDDVAIGGPALVGGVVIATVQVTNHSTQPSSYVVQIALDAADGVTQLDTAAVLVRSLAPGQSSTQIADFNGRKTIPPGARVTVKAVQRLAD